MFRVATVFCVLMNLWISESEAHEIPPSVKIQIFVRPEGQTLRVLVRVPLEAMRDTTIPTRDKGYLDLDQIEPLLRNATSLWITNYMEIYEENRKLENVEIITSRVSLPSNRSFERYDLALAHITGPRLSLNTNLYWEQGVLDTLFQYSINSERSDFSINPSLERLGLQVINVLTFISHDGLIHNFNFPGNPGRIPLDPNSYEVGFKFVKLGFFHILDGLDHLLFLFCLIVPFRKIRSLVLIVTSFTVAHSITLMASAFGYSPDTLWFPPLVETLIALSIIYMAFENIAGATLKRRWMITFFFGLIHGFGFSFILRETLQFAGTHLNVSLVAFNIGVELGQLLVIAIVVPLVGFFFRVGVSEKLGTIYISALITHSAWHWMVERVEQLRQFSFPDLNQALLKNTLHFLMYALILAVACWLFTQFHRGKTPDEHNSENTQS